MSLTRYNYGLSLKFQIAASPIVQERVFSFRQAVYNGSMEHLLHQNNKMHPAEDKFDAHSYIFYCQNGNDIVATCRWTPNFAGTWELTELSTNCFLPQVDPEDFIESSRLVICPSARNCGVAEVMVYFSCLWLTRYTKFNSYFAVCSPPLARFYKHFGLRVWSPQEIFLKGRSQRRYLIICGSLTESITLLHDYLTSRGWNLLLEKAAYLC